MLCGVLMPAMSQVSLDIQLMSAESAAGVWGVSGHSLVWLLSLAAAVQVT
jgi:hypothetical protein